jgi:hypothetical protein
VLLTRSPLSSKFEVRNSFIRRLRWKWFNRFLLCFESRTSNLELREPLDLHVLSAPPAFVLSQDQTLRKSSITLKKSLLALLILTLLFGSLHFASPAKPENPHWLLPLFSFQGPVVPSLLWPLCGGNNEYYTISQNTVQELFSTLLSRYLQFISSTSFLYNISLLNQEILLIRFIIIPASFSLALSSNNHELSSNVYQ